MNTIDFLTSMAVVDDVEEHVCGVRAVGEVAEHVVRAAMVEALARQVFGAEYVAALIDAATATPVQLVLHAGGAQ